MTIEYTSSFGYFFALFMIGLSFHIPMYYILKSFLGFGLMAEYVGRTK